MHLCRIMGHSCRGEPNIMYLDGSTADGERLAEAEAEAENHEREEGSDDGQASVKNVYIYNVK